MDISWQESDVLQCFKQLNLRPGRPISRQVLWHNWVTLSSGSNNDFANGLDGLIERGFVEVPDDEKPDIVSLTEAGYAALP